MKQPVEVEIMGQRLTVASDDSAEHVRRVAGFVDEQMRTLASGGAPMATLQLALITALNLASEYWKLHHKYEEMDRVINRMAERVSAGLNR